MRTDPIGVDGGINLFAYALNNPINLIDPLGLDPFSGIRDLMNVPTFSNELNAYKNIGNKIASEAESVLSKVNESVECGGCIARCSFSAYMTSKTIDVTVVQTLKSFGANKPTGWVVSKTSKKIIGIYIPVSKTGLGISVLECTLDCTSDKDYDLSLRTLGNYLNTKLPKLPGEMRWF